MYQSHFLSSPPSLCLYLDYWIQLSRITQAYTSWYYYGFLDSSLSCVSSASLLLTRHNVYFTLQTHSLNGSPGCLFFYEMTVNFFNPYFFLFPASRVKTNKTIPFYFLSLLPSYLFLNTYHLASHLPLH